MPESVGPFNYYKTREIYKNFAGGLVTDPPPHDLGPTELRAVRNLLMRPRGFLQLRTGQRMALSTSAVPDGITRFRTGSLVRLIVAAGGSIVSYNESTGVPQTLLSGAASGVRYTFATMYDRVFWVNGAGVVESWDGIAAAATAVGIVPPATAVGIPSGQSENPDRLTPCYYYVTFQNARGVESNPSPISVPINRVPPRYIDLPGQHTGTNLNSIPVSTDPQVTVKNLYRVGGGFDVPFRLAQIPNATTDYTDHLPNGYVSSITLSFSHDAPPAGATILFPSKTRLFLVVGNSVYVSSLGQPDYFPLTVTDPAVDGKAFDVEPDAENPIVALSGSGSDVLIARRRNCYIFSGDNDDNFTLGKICDVGCIAARSLVQCVDTAVWLSGDGMVWSVGASGPVCLTHESIARTLEAIPISDLPLACATYFRHQYHLCIPGNVGTGRACTYLVYDFRVSGWTDLSAAYMNASQIYSDTGLSDTNELYVATAAGFFDQSGAAAIGVVAALGPATTAGYSQSVDFDVWSGDLEFSRPDWIKRIYSVIIRGRLTPGTGTAPTLTLYARNASDSDTDAVSVSYPLTSTGGASGTLLATTVNAGITGQRLSWRLQGSASVFELEGVEITPIFIREHRQ